jgi:hypothetical protein
MWLIADWSDEIGAGPIAPPGAKRSPEQLEVERPRRREPPRPPSPANACASMKAGHAAGEYQRPRIRQEQVAQALGPGRERAWNRDLRGDGLRCRKHAGAAAPHSP